jgi:hypothetical protein
MAAGPRLRRPRSRARRNGSWSKRPASPCRLPMRLCLGVGVNVITRAPLYSLYGESLMKYTGRCQNNVSARGWWRRRSSAER